MPACVLDVAIQAYWIGRQHRFKREMAAMPPGLRVHLLPTGQTPTMRYNDFTRSAELTRLAYEASRAYLDSPEWPG